MCSATTASAGFRPRAGRAAVVAAAEAWGADRVVVETNQGGEMVESVLRSVDAGAAGAAGQGALRQGRRAEPVAALFETRQGEVRRRLSGARGPALRADRGGGYEGPGRSPDRADAMVWAMAELMLGGGARAAGQDAVGDVRSSRRQRRIAERTHRIATLAPRAPGSVGAACSRARRCRNGIRPVTSALDEPGRRPPRQKIAPCRAGIGLAGRRLSAASARTQDERSTAGRAGCRARSRAAKSCSPASRQRQRRGPDGARDAEAPPVERAEPRVEARSAQPSRKRRPKRAREGVPTRSCRFGRGPRTGDELRIM